MSIFIFLKNAFEPFLLLSQGTTIPEIRIPGQKMWAGWYRLKLHQSRGIRNQALMVLSRDVLALRLYGIRFDQWHHLSGQQWTWLRKIGNSQSPAAWTSSKVILFFISYSIGYWILNFKNLIRQLGITNILLFQGTSLLIPTILNMCISF